MKGIYCVSFNTRNESRPLKIEFLETYTAPQFSICEDATFDFDLNIRIYSRNSFSFKFYTYDKNNIMKGCDKFFEILRDHLTNCLDEFRAIHKNNKIIFEEMIDKSSQYYQKIDHIINGKFNIAKIQFATSKDLKEIKQSISITECIIYDDGIRPFAINQFLKLKSEDNCFHYYGGIASNMHNSSADFFYANVNLLLLPYTNFRSIITNKIESNNSVFHMFESLHVFKIESLNITFFERDFLNCLSNKKCETIQTNCDMNQLNKLYRKYMGV